MDNRHLSGIRTNKGVNKLVVHNDSPSIDHILSVASFDNARLSQTFN